MYKPFPVMGGKNCIVLTTSSMGRPCLSYVALSIFLSRRQVAKRQPSQHLASRSLDRLGRDVWCWESRRCPGHIFSRPHYVRTGIMVNKGIIPKWPYFRLVNYYNLPRYIYIYIYTPISCILTPACYEHVWWISKNTVDLFIYVIHLKVVYQLTTWVVFLAKT